MKKLFWKVLVVCLAVVICYLAVFKFFSVIISTGCVALVGYFALYKCCEILLSKRDTDFSGLMKEFGVVGIARIILETFEVVGSGFREFASNLVRKERKAEPNNDFFARIVDMFHEAMKFCLKRLFFQKNDKPIMKISKKEDFIILFGYLVELAKSGKTASFKEVVEQNWRDKWSYFAHSSYLYVLAYEVENVCKKSNLLSLSVLITYNNGRFVDRFFQKDKELQSHQNEKVDDFINVSRKDNDEFKNEVFREYLPFFADNIEKYIALFNELKNGVLASNFNGSKI